MTLSNVEMTTSANDENGPISACHVSILNPYPGFGFLATKSNQSLTY